MKNGWLLFLVLLCVAFLVSCGKNEMSEIKDGELVKYETRWETAWFSFGMVQNRILLINITFRNLFLVK